MKLRFILFVSSLAAILTSYVFMDQDSVLIQSWESKTKDQLPVFNRIKYIPGFTREIWMMNQSHHGSSAPGANWDRLAIVIDSNKEAQFLQLPPGELEWKEEYLQKGIGNKVSCFMCHSNGPRAIRPDPNFKLSLKEKVKITLWNLRIKTYRRIKEAPIHKIQDKALKIPFRNRAKFDNEELNIASCTRCHSEDSLVQRGPLTRQNFLSIRFMLEKKLMPPPGFEITSQDKLRLHNFLLGFN
jgi:hypothetical protein